MKRNAFSLPELLVALGLAGLVLSILTALVIWGMRVFAQQSVENQRFQLGSLIMKRLRTDLRASCAEGVSVGQASIAIHRLKDLTSSGQQVWDDSLVVYTFASARVTRSTFRLVASTNRPVRLTSEQLRVLSPSESVSLMDYVSTFSPRLEGRTFSLDLTTDYRVPHRAQPGRQQFQTSINLRVSP